MFKVDQPEVLHPLYIKYNEILINEFLKLQNLDMNNIEEYVNFFLGFTKENEKEPQNVSIDYKNKIKGFHLAFNVHEPVK